MCLSTVYDEEKQAKIIKKITKKGGWITIYKVFKPKLCATIFSSFHFKEGLNVSPARMFQKLCGWNGYIPYFHSYQTRKGAESWQSKVAKEKIIRCKVRPSWITAIGNLTCGSHAHAVIVSRKIII